MNRILNAAIGLVVVTIFLVAGFTIFGGGNDSEPAMVADENEDDTEVDNDEENIERSESEEELNTNTEGSQEDSSNGDGSSDPETTDLSEGTEEEDIEEEESDENEESDSENRDSPVGEGNWEPIGTVQEEPFTAVYDSSHVNWDEMTEALKYATEIDGDMTIWYLGNGGDAQSAVGTVSGDDGQKYEVRIEWVENRGWKPIYVEETS